nr:hypothetical protein CFP56_09733 [Quercus suber]
MHTEGLESFAKVQRPLLDVLDLVVEERLVDICIAGMLYEYRPYFENLQIPSFTRLVKASRRTKVSVKKPSKGSTSSTTSAFRQPWKRESKKIKRALVDTGVSTKILPLPTLDALDIPRERIIREPLQVAGIGSLQQHTLGHVYLDLRVGPIKAHTLMHVMDGARLPSSSPALLPTQLASPAPIQPFRQPNSPIFAAIPPTQLTDLPPLLTGPTPLPKRIPPLAADPHSLFSSSLSPTQAMGFAMSLLDELLDLATTELFLDKLLLCLSRFRCLKAAATVEARDDDGRGRKIVTTAAA